MDTPRANIDFFFHTRAAAAALLTGYILGWVIYAEVTVIFNLDLLLVLRTLLGTAIALALLEMIYVRTKTNKVQLVNYTWIMYIGLTVYLIIKAC